MNGRIAQQGFLVEIDPAGSRPEVVPVILNEDGSFNSPGHPAPRGSVVTFWASGGGAMSQMVDGAVNRAPLPKLTLPVTIALGTLSPHDSGIVTYAGAAPEMVAGVLQINFRIPPAHSGYGACSYACPVILEIGTKASPQPYPTVWVQD